MKKAIIIGLFFLLAGHANAEVLTFFGEDLGLGESTRLETWPNASAAASDFNSNLVGVATESFENFSSGDSAPLNLTFGTTTATLTGVGSVIQVASGTNGFGRYPTDGKNLFETASLNFSVNFDEPQAAFGFFGIDLGDFQGRVTFTTINGGRTTCYIPHTIGAPGGSVIFFGIIDTDNPFTSVEFGNIGSGADCFGYDQMTVGIPEAIVQDFLWQEIEFPDDTYTVEVRANKVPPEPYRVVYPSYDPSFDPDYEAKAITVRDSGQNVVTDDETKRKVLSYARNVALYRSLADATEDPIPILDTLGGFKKVPITPEATYCLGLLKLGGGTDTSFGYSYPGHFVFPGEYTTGNGIPDIVDWENDWKILAEWCGGIPSLHPVGIKSYEKRKEAYEELLRKMIIQESLGILNELLDGAAKDFVIFLEEVQPYIQVASTTQKVDKIILLTGGVSITAKILKAIMASEIFTYSDIVAIKEAIGIRAANNLTSIAGNTATVFLTSISIISEGYQIATRLTGDALTSIIYTSAVISYGRDILDSLNGTLFSSSSGMDPALWEAYNSVKTKISVDAEKEWWLNLGQEFLNQAYEHGFDYTVDTIQIGLGTAIVANALAPEPIFTKGTALVLSLVAAALEAVQHVAHLIENQEVQQKIVLATTLEYSWWDNPLARDAIIPLQVCGPVHSTDIDQFNWLLSTKLYQGIFVTEMMFDLSEGFFNDTKAWWNNIFGNGSFDLRRKEVVKYNDKLLKVFFGKGDSDSTLSRLCGRPRAEGQYIGFVPKSELDVLVNLTSQAPVIGYELGFILNSPGQIGIVDPAGRHFGTFCRDAGGEDLICEEIEQIPGASYSGSSSHPREILIPDPIPGDYKICLFGTGSGTYTLQVQSLAQGTVVEEHTATGTFAAGRREDAVVNVDSEEGFVVVVTSEPLPRGSISGTVVRAVSGNPVEGARVSVVGTSDITTGEGLFAIANIPPGMIVISATASGFVNYISEVIDLAPGETLHRDIELTALNTPPDVEITAPYANAVIQDGVTLTAEANDDSGMDTVHFYVREPDDENGIPIGFEGLEATLNTTTSEWEYTFDSTQLPDGYYVIIAKAIDANGNEGWSTPVLVSIQNWAVVELLPNTTDNKAGRTMPVKFALRIAAAVDPKQPFVYNQELEIRIYDASAPNTILQTSLYGDTSTDYRIDTAGELYITNFKTSKTLADYVVEIWRMSKNFLVGSFTFETVK